MLRFPRHDPDLPDFRKRVPKTDLVVRHPKHDPGIEPKWSILIGRFDKDLGIRLSTIRSNELSGLMNESGDVPSRYGHPYHKPPMSHFYREQPKTERRVRMPTYKLVSLCPDWRTMTKRERNKWRWANDPIWREAQLKCRRNWEKKMRVEEPERYLALNRAWDRKYRATHREYLRRMAMERWQRIIREQPEKAEEYREKQRQRMRIYSRVNKELLKIKQQEKSRRRKSCRKWKVSEDVRLESKDAGLGC